MSKCIQLYNKYKGISRITGNQYIDPEGFEYKREHVVNCGECMFLVGYMCCALYKDQGFEDSQVASKIKSTNSNHFCDYFLIKDFSEGDSLDEKVRKEVLSMKSRLNCPVENVARTSINKKEDNNTTGCSVMLTIVMAAFVVIMII